MFCVLWFFFCFLKRVNLVLKSVPCCWIQTHSGEGEGGGCSQNGWQTEANHIWLADSPRQSPSHWLTVRGNLHLIGWQSETIPECLSCSGCWWMIATRWWRPARRSRSSGGLLATPRALCRHYGPPCGPCIVTMGHPAGLVSSLWATPRALCRHYRPPRGPCVARVDVTCTSSSLGLHFRRCLLMTPSGKCQLSRPPLPPPCLAHGKLWLAPGKA